MRQREVPVDEAHRTGAQRTAYVLEGILGVGAGVVTLFWPHVTALVLVVMIGIWALVTGIVEILAATRVGGGWLLVVVGVLSLLAGILLLVRPAAGAIAIAQVIGIVAPRLDVGTGAGILPARGWAPSSRTSLGWGTAPRDRSTA